MVVSTYLGLALLAIAVLLLLGACWVSLRGVGGISTLRIALKETQAGLERVDERITREVKTRAGNTRAEIAAEEKDVAQQAAQILAQEPIVVPMRSRPSRLLRRT